MKAYPRLTRQRLAELPIGTPFKLGALNVIFDGCTIEPNYKGEDETFVYYIDEAGKCQRHAEFVILQSATEFIDSERCAYCGKFRAPEDITQRFIQFWNRQERHAFCSDLECAKLYQQTIRLPSATRVRLHKRNVA